MSQGALYLRFLGLEASINKVSFFMLQITESPTTVPRFALWQLGFRPFFFAASLFAVIGTVLWTGLYSFQWSGLPVSYPAMTWHAHEMIFAYALAVIAGFLLTAVKNWTGLTTVQGYGLAVLASVWLLARCLPFTGLPLFWTALADLAFLVGLLLAVARPIVLAKQWTQAGILAKIGFLTLANSMFYLGLLGYWPLGAMLGLYLSFYLVLALILTMGRRVFPFFIEKGLGVPFVARNHVWVDRLSLVLFLAFVVLDLVAMSTGNSLFMALVAGLALIQALLHSLRLQGWYHPLIWHKPLLWVLYLAYAWLVIGFLLKFLSLIMGISPWLAVHAFAYGGIGMMTLGMMTRVSLGHTGRDVTNPPAILVVLFALLALGALIRVFLVWWLPAAQAVWVLAAQFLWIATFAGLVWVYAPMWLQPRVDGRPG